MNDYARMYQKSYLPPSKKVGLIRRVLRSNVSQTLMLAAITLIVEASANK